jgi:hypothetical protein
MEELLIFKQLIEALPSGVFYTTENTVPHKTEPYSICIDTLQPQTQIYVDANSTRYSFITDDSGILNINLVLNLGLNIIKWRLANTSGWREIRITTTHLATIQAGVGLALKQLFDSAFAGWQNLALLTAADLGNFKFLSGIDIVDKKIMQECLQTFYNFCETNKSLSQISGCLCSVSGIVKDIGNLIPGRNLVNDPNFDDIAKNYFLDGGTNTQSVTAVTDLFLKNLVIEGTGSFDLYVNISNKLIQYGNWLFDLYAKVEDTTNVGIVLALSYDGVTWEESAVFTVDTQWIPLSLLTETGLPPLFCKISCESLSGGTLYLAGISVLRDCWVRTEPFLTSGYKGIKTKKLLLFPLGNSFEVSFINDDEEILPLSDDFDNNVPCMRPVYKI